MSDRDQDVETKAGHPPALKVGGVRVAQRARSPTGEGKAAQDPENPQIPAKDSDQAGDSSVTGIGGLQNKPKDLLVQGKSGIPVTAKDLEIQNEGIHHTHDKGINQSKLGNKQSVNQNPSGGARNYVEQQPRNHGTNH
ncbi:hypothetical protein BV898_04362 [Hypsibius exemplaris]|uniref:Death-associated protein 1 n=1 Tax=Hypsibius exemplaris TaxID=2072580 RepID=A0A1W0X2Q6_HYPEX|nr:hypothetical protein BV898_04362 [Hypsibius exemplaris]